jgi:hypothetical protein
MIDTVVQMYSNCRTASFLGASPQTPRVGFAEFWDGTRSLGEHQFLLVF